MKHPAAPDAPLDTNDLEQAALYALSALSASEMEAVERDYRERRAFWAEVRSLRDAAAGLAESGPRASPKRDLWPDVAARLAHVRPGPTAGEAERVQPWKRWTQESAPECLVPADDAAFEPTDIAGIHVRRLFVDEPNDRITMLVRMAPGTAYPAHRHGGVEECFVLQGDLEIGATTELRAGDYQRMDVDSVHEVQSTRGGCVLLITSSRHDELLG